LNRSQGYKYQKVLWTFFVIVGTTLLIVSVFIFICNLLILATTKSVRGTIIELVPKPNDSLERHFLKVVFREETTKRRFEFISSQSFSPTAYNEDERITVFYDPENPEDAMIGDFRNFLAIPTFLFLFAVFFFFCTFLAIMIRRKIMRQTEK